MNESPRRFGKKGTAPTDTGDVPAGSANRLRRDAIQFVGTSITLIDVGGVITGPVRLPGVSIA
jgi:hypothetical protein